MGIFFKLFKGLWVGTDLPLPFLGATIFGVAIRAIIYYLGVLLVIPLFPFIYLYGLYKWFNTGRKPEWFYAFWFSALFGWYIYCLGFWIRIW